MTDDASEKLSKRFGTTRRGVNVEVNVEGVAAHLDDVAILHTSNHADHHGSDPRIVEEIKGSVPTGTTSKKEEE